MVLGGGAGAPSAPGAAAASGAGADLETMGKDGYSYMILLLPLNEGSANLNGHLLFSRSRF